MKKVITVICIMLCLVGTSCCICRKTRQQLQIKNTVTGKLIEIKRKRTKYIRRL